MGRRLPDIFLLRIRAAGSSSALTPGEQSIAVVGPLDHANVIDRMHPRHLLANVHVDLPQLRDSHM